MNIKIVESALVPFLVGTLCIIAFYWQFNHTYAFLIEHFKDEKISLIYAHLLIYSFLILTLFIFIINVINNLLIKSKVFLITAIVPVFIFYAVSYQVFLNSFNYFINYPLSVNATLFMVLFIISSISFGLYSLVLPFFRRFIPFSHSVVFWLIGILYALCFIDTHAYPINEILTKLNINFI